MEIKKFKKDVGTTPSGTVLSIFGYKLIGTQKGPRIYIQSGIHGGEVTIWIIEQLYSYITKQSFSGEVTLIPLANPAAWNQRTYFSTTGKFDLYMGKDWNRNFPGSEDGSLGERIAYALLSEARNADFVIDLHTSRESIPFGITGSKNDLSYAKKLGLEYTFFIDYLKEIKLSQYKNTLLGQMCKNNIPNITIECGKHDSYDKRIVDEIVIGIKNLFSSLGLLEENIETTNKKSKYFTELKKYRAPIGGFIKFSRELNASYNKGDKLFEIISPEKLEKPIAVIAEENGVLFKKSPTHIFWTGDEVLETIPLESIKTIS